MSCSLLAVIARAEDNLYRRLRNHAKQLKNDQIALRLSLNKETKSDILKKFSVTQAFDFEAAIHLEQWDDLETIIDVSL
jgi:hypothetical protein